MLVLLIFFFLQAEDGIRDPLVTGVQTCALPICHGRHNARLKPESRRRFWRFCWRSDGPLRTAKRHHQPGTAPRTLAASPTPTRPAGLRPTPHPKTLPPPSGRGTPEAPQGHSGFDTLLSMPLAFAMLGARADAGARPTAPPRRIGCTRRSSLTLLAGWGTTLSSHTVVATPRVARADRSRPAGRVNRRRWSSSSAPGGPCSQLACCCRVAVNTAKVGLASRSAQ